MNLEILKTELQPLEAIILPGNEAGQFRIVEKSARAVAEFNGVDETSEKDLARQVRSVFSKQRKSLNVVSVHVVQEAIDSPDICRALIALESVLAPDSKAQIIFHIEKPFTDWASLQSKVKCLREGFAKPKEVDIGLLANFDEFREKEMEALFDLGVRVRFAAGWSSQCRPGQVLQTNRDVLRQFSRFGFRTPIHWYVHAGNLAQFEEQLEELLLDNYNSGFALPLVAESPYYKFEPGFPELPDAVEYCRLLVRYSQNYPYYDDVFSPLTTLAYVVREGGWNPTLNLPTVLNFVVNAHGKVGFHRGSPALALDWASTSELAGLDKSALRKRLLKFIGDSVKWEKTPYCSDCGWRHLCGGLGASADCGLTKTQMDTMCGYRKLFLEHFANLRAPDMVYPQPKSA